MRISRKLKFIFFANPKTGSESVRKLLDPVSEIRGVAFRKTTPRFPFYSHMRPSELKAVMENAGASFDEFYRFTFVRNPWARLVSLYKMIKRLEPAFSLPFSEWVEGTATDGAGGGGHDSERWRKYGTYSLASFAGDGAGKLLVNDVYRMEDMPAAISSLRDRGVVPPGENAIPRINVSADRASYQSYYDGAARDLVRDRYREEIEAFGYRFDGAD